MPKRKVLPAVVGGPTMSSRHMPLQVEPASVPVRSRPGSGGVEPAETPAVLNRERRERMPRREGRLSNGCF
jgi:hypothetical protein